ncbi:interleukin-31 receptor subunit alpha isoform X1 [Canis lupus baileyi]|uniref:Interleukin-31 receptor subunit alpha n=2 Tax=Canis lupus familiaris TaxID=9615 RepID=A0A8C0MKG9_CANLF|nr:interleukin-31 receptor subunit alpha isoform X2 [Canis lupus familiaris]XP_025303963.1 interleukin-31 receptor subunit alpha isoform X1 [Canis lupus dingo]XP_038386551.1 interleukin-31 receptor subunit alpha isoform X2 [Canis lupus familiaris]XP_038514842.1 interleukin-31 receptor subunit alpha isoform X2 [Canis lupus familiaris]XP_048958676.1 interleukin-31 receptor subunit alpha isoform X1 [Canis lupus dingo]XP_048958677.1 interleukin-31 receptor subunit alpha isoform X1 [Canis lupus din|eukprot:XP_005617453.1 interleukin-31 receptor subunit alpha isoform X1 [Canis lupus familiaris]
MMWAKVLWMLLLLCKLSLAVLPAKPENISCIFYYEENFTCTWSPEKEASYTWYKVKRTYSYGYKSDICSTDNSTRGNHASCSFLPPTITNPDNYTIQVEAQNADGIMKSDITYWNLDAIMKIEPPEIFSVKSVLGIKRMLQIKWIRPVLAPHSSTLKYTLRFRTINSAYWMEVNFTKEDIDRDETYNLTELQAFTEYVMTLRCAPAESMFWSGWSQEKVGTTEEEAPYGLDLWRVLKPAMVDGRRPVQLMWKKATGAPVLEKALGYNIWYFPENNTNLTETVNTTNQTHELYLGGKTYWVYVVSYNSLGESPVATLRIPALNEKTFQCIEAMQACLTQDQLVVEWQSSAPEVDTWMVEWFPDVDSEPSSFSWESVSQARNWTIQKDELKPLWCYNISVYPVLRDRVGQPYSTQAYVQEGIPSAGPVTQADSIGVKTVTITWKEIPKSKRNGFIKNYTIFYQAEDGKEFSKTVNSNILQYRLESLTRRTSYSLQVMASTNAGGTNGTKINFKTLSISVLEIFFITSLVGGGFLILIMLTVAYGLKKPNKLKHLCWPDVPNPAESSIATWRGDDFKDKLNLKESDDPVNMEEDQVLKPYSAPTDFIDKLVVNFENFLEEVSTEELGKSQENILKEEKNKHVTSPYCLHHPPISTEIPQRKPQQLCSRIPEGTCSETKEQLFSSVQSLGPDHLCEEGEPNPYLKNSVTTREFVCLKNFKTKPKEKFSVAVA